MSDIDEAILLIEELAKVQSENRLESEYGDLRLPGAPYDWQQQFHEAGRRYKFRAILAGNRCGKTRSAAAEIAMHLTGVYPSWWKGKRYKGPNDWCICGQTNEELRNIEQKALFGEIAQLGNTRGPDGTGWIPRDRIGQYGFRQCGVTNVLDYVKVKHVSGGWSSVMLKSYEQGALKFQGFEVDGMWFDEEPEQDDIFPEAITRLITRDGIFIFTRTPLFGNSEIILKFIQDDTDITWYITASMDDAPHMTERQKEEVLALYPEHERETRMRGIPLMGSGGVYPVAHEEIKCEWFEIPNWFRRIAGIDFGIDHPGAAVWGAHDPESDVVYVTDCYKQSGQTAAYHADAIRSRGDWIPVAWPHDGMIRDKGGGETLASQFESKGVNMLPQSARYDDYKGGGQATEPIVMEILGRMRTGRFKVMDTPANRAWFEEQQMYHRKDGVIVKIRDDIMAATNYMMMMLRYAIAEAESGPPVVLRNLGADFDPLKDF